MSEPRVKTSKEIRDEFFALIYRLIDHIDGDTRNKTSREKLELLAFSMMNVFDGTSFGIGCGFFLVPTCHPSDPEFHQEDGQNWYPVNEMVEKIMEGEISGGDMLHDAFINYPMGRDTMRHESS